MSCSDNDILDSGVSSTIEVDSVFLSKDSIFFSDEEYQDWLSTRHNTDTSSYLRIENGRALFNSNCNNCHPNNFRKPATGPALGNVTMYRDMTWLIEYTKSSTKMIKSGDILATCLFYNWQGSVMNNFEHLTDKEIENIYLYIEDESKNQKIKKDEVKYIKNCNLDSLSSRW